jgi:hypothetical protein
MKTFRNPGFWIGITLAAIELIYGFTSSIVGVPL